MKRSDGDITPAGAALPRQRGVPQRDPALANLSLAEVRARRKALMAEENSVSYWRRVVQAKLDLIDTDAAEPLTLDSVVEVLRDADGAQQRVAYVSLSEPQQLPPVPDLVELWQLLELGEISGSDAATRLREAESQLSRFRSEVHQRLDQFTGELIARYRENPGLAVTALPLAADPPGPANAGLPG